MNRRLFKIFKLAACTLALAALLTPAHPALAKLNKTTEMVRMPDGVLLATDIYLPETKDKVPTVLIRTTYGREGMAPMITPLFEGRNTALVIQDTRGRGGSGGVSAVFITDPLDGYETVEWIARQPWSNGKIGTAGISALGITQYMMDKLAPPHLTCQNVMAAPPSLYHTIVYTGGAVRRSLFYGWILGLKFPVENMHLILSQPDYSDMWRATDLTPDFNKVNIPIMHMAGWYDLYLNGQLKAFEGIQKLGGPGARGKQRLVIGPWIHGNFIGIYGTKQGDLNYPSNSVYNIMKLADWFDECLKGKDKGYMKGPVVRYYVMGDVDDMKAPGNTWRTADTWPVPNDPTPFYFHKDGVLDKSKPKSSGDSATYTDDPANPVPTLGSLAHADERHTVDLRPITTRPDVLTFTTPVLDKPLEVTGPITAKIFFKTDVVDTDFVVRLADVYPDGRVMLVTDGIIRASHRESFEYRKPLTPGQTYSVDVEIWPTSIIFNKGHRIAVVVSSTNFPRFDVNMHNGQYFDISAGELEKAVETSVTEYVNKPDLAPDSVPAHTTIFLDSANPSQIILPLAPARKPAKKK